jgi:hypothetical protein
MPVRRPKRSAKQGGKRGTPSPRMIQPAAKRIAHDNETKDDSSEDGK